VTARDQLHQDRVEELIRGTRRIKQKEIAGAFGISKDRVRHIIGVLGFRKVSIKDGFQKLVQRWRKCIEVRGDFVEK